MWSLHIHAFMETTCARINAQGGAAGDDVTTWLQLIVQGGAMALLTMLVFKAPGWIDSLVTRILNATGTMHKEAIAGFQASLKDIRLQGQQTITLLETHFYQRNEVLRLSIDNQSRQLSQEMQEISRMIEGMKTNKPRSPPTSKTGSGSI